MSITQAKTGAMIDLLDAAWSAALPAAGDSKRDLEQRLKDTRALIRLARARMEAA